MKELQVGDTVLARELPNISSENLAQAEKQKISQAVVISLYVVLFSSENNSTASKP
jgi:hypothetical protein